jgi:hypothetical protein
MVHSFVFGRLVEAASLAERASSAAIRRTRFASAADVVASQANMHCTPRFTAQALRKFLMCWAMSDKDPSGHWDVASRPCSG